MSCRETLVEDKTYATIATDIEANVTDICNQDKKVRSLAKYTLGSTLTGT